MLTEPLFIEEYNDEREVVQLNIYIGNHTYSPDGVYNFEGGSFYVENNVITQVFNTHDENQLELELN